MDYKTIIIKELETLRAYETAEKAVFKARAYANVIKVLKQLEKPILSIDDVSSLPGVGESIKAKILEIIGTGSSSAANSIRNDPSTKSVEVLMGVYGIGVTKAKALIAKGVTNIKELREHTELLNDKQLIGLRVYEDLLERIPRSEMEEHREVLTTIIKNTVPSANFQIVGSYRRGADSSGDIDLLINNVSNKQFKDIIDELIKTGYITDSLANGPKKFMGVCNLSNSSNKNKYKSRRLDMLLTPPESYIYSLVYFTGSDKFNISMRKRAIEMGYTLNEHGLTKLEGGKEEVKLTSENDLFDFLGMEWVSPENR